MTWKVLARHKDWAVNCTVTESINMKNDRIRRFTATIQGFRNWKVYEGILQSNTAEKVSERVREIRNKIESGKYDESLFSESQKLEGSL